jgi:two-component system response regulator HydG
MSESPAVPVYRMPSVRCLACELRQFTKDKCSRCGRALPKLDLPKVVIREVEAVKSRVEYIHPAPGAFTVFADPLPKIAELEALYVREALRRCNGDVVLAARLMGMGKTTLYRKLKDILATEKATEAVSA